MYSSCTDIDVKSIPNLPEEKTFSFGGLAVYFPFPLSHLLLHHVKEKIISSLERACKLLFLKFMSSNVNLML